MISAKDFNGVYAAFDEQGMDAIIYVPADSFYEGVTKPCSILRIIYPHREICFMGDLADNFYDGYLREYELEQYATDNSCGFENEDVADFDSCGNLI